MKAASPASHLPSASWPKEGTLLSSSSLLTTILKPRADTLWESPNEGCWQNVDPRAADRNSNGGKHWRLVKALRVP
jgi:hypothetical protein